MKENKQIDLTEEQKELAKKLTPLQRKFIIELIKPNVTQRQAYVAAGGKSKTPEAQDAAASRMLSDVRVNDFYQSLINTKTKSSIMTREEALERLSKSARIKITDICEFSYVGLTGADGETHMNTVWKMKDAKDIDPDVAACIKSVTFTKTGPKIELYDANGSIKLLSDIQGWNAPKKTEISGEGGQPIQIKSDVNSPEIASALKGLMEKL